MAWAFFMAKKQSGWSAESRHKRGYGSNWDKIRLLVLQRDKGLCQCGDCKGIKLTLATEVDHIIPKSKGGTDDLENLQAINRECHKLKTAQEQGRTLRPKQTIGVDGFPL